MSKIAAGLALALMSFSAGAAVQAGIWLEAPQIDVFDLNVHDGFTASFVEGGPRVGSFHDVLKPAPYGSSTIGAAQVWESDDALTGQATGADSTFIGIGDRYAQSFTYTVTPHTRVTLSAPYSMRVVADETRSSDGSNGGFASFELTVLAVQNPSVAPTRSEPDRDWLYHGSDAAVLGGEGFTPLLGHHESSGVLTLSFENTTDTAAVFAYRGEMVIWGTSSGQTMPITAPVPEPGTIALMLAGLGVVGWQVRRRRPA